MGKLSVCASFVVLAISCGGSSGAKNNGDAGGSGDGSSMPMDACGARQGSGMVTAYSCLGDGAPTSANPTVTFSGSVTELDVSIGLSGVTATEMPISGASLDACTGDCTGGNQLATATSDMSGDFSLGPLSTGCSPLDAYAQMAYSGDVSVLAYAGEPATVDVTGVPIITIKTGTLSDLHALGCSNTTTDGLAIVVVTDCTGTTITDTKNITLTVKQNGTQVAGAKVIDLGQLAGSMAAGLLLVCELPPGVTNFGASYMSMTFLAHDVNILAATATETQIRPGY